MKALKPVFLKTYGKDTRKLPAWLSPDNRKQAFDTTRSTDGDGSVYEPEKLARTREKRTTVAGRRTGRPAKRKAVLCLAEKSCDEETPASPSCPPPAQQSKTTRVKRTRVADGRPSRLAKRKAALWLVEASSDEENISRLSPPGPPPAQQRRTTSGHLRSSSRFVTQRRRAAACKPKLLKTAINTLNSSDDFTAEAFVPRRTLRTLRTRAPPSFVLSSAENSVNAAGTAGFATNPFREISLNESTDHSLGPCPRKPIFCSTPSAGSFSRRPRLKPLSINNQSLAPPSTSVSCIGVVSPFQDDVESSGPPVSPTHSSPPIGLHSEEKPQSSNGEQDPDLHHHEEPSDDLFVEPKRTNKRSSCREEGKSHCEDIKSKNVGELASLYLLSTDNSESNSCFVSAAAGGLEWLIEALKKKCLTGRCTVQLERLGSLAESQLCSHSTYSSCLGLSSSAGQKDEHPLSVDSCQTIEHSCDYFLLVNSSESSEHVASVTDSQSTNKQHSATQESMEQSASVLLVESTHHKDESAEFIMDTQLAACGPINHSSVQTLFAVALKDECLTNKCTIQLKEMALTQQKSENDQKLVTEDSDDLTRSGERVVASVNNNSLGAQTPSNDPTALAAMLKEKCLSDKVSVGIKRLTFSQLKDILQLKPTKLKTPTDASDSASDDQSRHDHHHGMHHGNKDTSVMQVNVRKRGSASFEDNLASDKEKVKNVPHKGKKSLAPKQKKRRKSTPKDRSGTTRKARVSGLCTSRWKNQAGGSTHAVRSRTKTVDCSINELIPTQHRQPWERLGSTMNFSTPLRASRLNLSSLLADLTPNTHTWSRLKAALSVHRKSQLCLTPGRLHQSVLVTPRRAKLADVSQDLFATPFRTLLPKHLRSQLWSRDSPVVCEDADLSDAEKVCAECSQPRPLPWEACILPGRMKQCVKIGEGTFGEVFSTTNAAGDTVALKVIPVEGSEKVNGEDQKTFGEILHEIIISKELSSLKEKQQNKTHGFIGLNDLHCVQGYYPPDFLNAWDTFDQKKGSENDRPDFFEKDQLFLILEFEFGGSDLENSNGTLTSLLVAKSILHQVTAAMAVAEQELHFEHRDLHWGNVLVKTTKQKTASFLLNGAVHSLETKGVLVRIIDYSLSRLEIDDLTVSCDISNDEELFLGQGDYQFDIYRLMREENGNNWSDYHPRTNVLWLHYLCSKLLSMKYRGAGGRATKGMREEFARFCDNLLRYSSATEALQTMFQ